MIDTFNGALTLNQALFRGMRESPDGVRRGLMLVLLVGLLVGSVQGINSIITNANPDRVIAEIETTLDENLQQQALAATDDAQRELIKIIMDNKAGGLNLMRTLMVLPAPAPRPVGIVLRGIGLVVSTPLSYLGSLLLAIVFTHIAARQLGGEGSLQQMLGLGALSVAPHALDALGFIPNIGSTLGMIAWIWGLVILTIATSVAHRIDSGRATLAVLLYPLIGSLLLLLSCCVLVILIGALGV